MGLKPHSLHLPHSLSLLTLWHKGTVTAIHSRHTAPLLFLDRSELLARSQWCKKAKKLFVMDGRASHLDRSRCYVIESCTPTGYVYFCCGWQFLRRFWREFDEFLGIPNKDSQGHHTSWLQLPFPSKFNYAIIFLSDFCFRWEVLKSSHLKQQWKAFYYHPSQLDPISPI